VRENLYSVRGRVAAYLLPPHRRVADDYEGGQPLEEEEEE